MDGPVFVKFVSAAPGRLCSRFDAPQSYIGARRASEDEVRANGDRIVWNLEQVVALTKEYCDRFDRELRHAIANGDLLERTEADFTAWQEEERKRDEALHPPEKAADAPAPSTTTTTTEVPGVLVSDEPLAGTGPSDVVAGFEAPTGDEHALPEPESPPAAVPRSVR